MKRIVIIGINGAGKSTLATNLGKIIDNNVFYLDKLYWKKGWVKPSKDEWQETIDNLISQESWIIDGNYASTMDQRIARADTVIYLDYSKLEAIIRVVKRVFIASKIKTLDKKKGVEEKVTLDLIKKILFYPKSEMKSKLKTLTNKQIIILKNDNEVSSFLKNLR